MLLHLLAFSTDSINKYTRISTNLTPFMNAKAVLKIAIVCQRNMSKDWLFN